jgi:hypothetical protein
MDKPPCQATASHGGRCRAWAPGGADFCRVHDPSKAAEVQAARIRGAEKAGRLRLLRGKRRRLEDAGRLAVFLSDLVEDVLAGRVNADVARCAIYGASVLRQVIETSELERRLAALEAAMGATTVRRVR